MIGDDMTPLRRPAFLAAAAVLTVALTTALSACGTTPQPGAGQGGAGQGGAGQDGAGTASPAAGSTGSGGADGPAVLTRAAVPPAARRVQCPAYRTPVLRQLPTAEPAEPIPAGFTPVAVVECITVSSDDHGVLVTDQRREAAVTGLSQLLAALREPSTPRPKGEQPACMVPLTLGPWFVLVSGTGQVIRPVVPVGLCGEPLQPVLASLNALHWITLSIVRVPAQRPPLRGGPIHDITPAVTGPNKPA